MTNQQISLAGTIQNSELKIVLYTLASISGVKPRKVMDHCISWVPTNSFRPTLGAGQVNQIEQYRITTTCEEDEEQEDQSKPDASNVVDVDMDEQPLPATKTTTDLDKKWTLHMSEVPEAGKRKTTSRSTSKSRVIQGNVFDFIENLGYSFSYEYWLKGYEFVVNRILVRIVRILVHPTQSTEPKTKDAESLVLVDASGQWTVSAEINVKQLTDVDAMAQATAQLERFQQEIAPLFELKMPDRASYDTRVR